MHSVCNRPRMWPAGPAPLSAIWPVSVCAGCMGWIARQNMLALAIAKNRDNQARFFCQDLKNLRLPEPVDLITCNFDSLNYLLTTDDLLRALRVVPREPQTGWLPRLRYDHAAPALARFQTLGRAGSVEWVRLPAQDGNRPIYGDAEEPGVHYSRWAHQPGGAPATGLSNSHSRCPAEQS